LRIRNKQLANAFVLPFINCSLLIVILFFLPLYGWADEPVTYTSDLLPRPRQMIGERRFIPVNFSSFEVLTGKPDGAVELAKKMLSERAAKLSLGVKGGGKLRIILGKFENEPIMGADKEYSLNFKQVVLPAEGYVLRVRQKDDQTIIIAAGQDSRGAFYAAMTLLQEIGIENGRTGIRTGDVNDWPEWSHRYMSDYIFFLKSLYTDFARYKVNGFAMQHRREWRDFGSGKSTGYWKLPTYDEALKEMKSFKDETGLMDFMLVLNIYADRNQPMFNMTDEKDITDLADRCKWAASYGIDHIMIATDDWTPSENGRYVCPHQSEREKFGNSPGRAVGYLMRRLHDLVKPEYPNLEFSICGAVYSLYDHKATEPEGRRYLRDLAAQTPEDIAIVWTGPRVISSIMSREDYLTFSRIVNNHKQFLWDNSDCINLPIADSPAKFYDGFANDSNGLMFINTKICMETLIQFNLAMGDYLWNPNGFDPNTAFRVSTEKVYGTAAYPPLKGYTEKHKKLELAKGNRKAELKLIGEIQENIKQLIAAGYPAERLTNEMTSRQALLASEPPALDIPKFSASPTLDGKLDDACWSVAAKFSFKPLTKADPTEGRIGYDSRNLYLAFTAHYSRPLPIIPAGTKEHDDVIYALSDSVEIFLQPGGKGDYNHFVLDYMGNRYDEMAMNGPGGWNADWKVKVSKTDTTWTAEVVIPFNSWTSKPPKHGDTWKANFCRSTVGIDETSAWSNYPGNPGFHTQELFGTLRFK